MDKGHEGDGEGRGGLEERSGGDERVLSDMAFCISAMLFVTVAA